MDEKDYLVTLQLTSMMVAKIDAYRVNQALEHKQEVTRSDVIAFLLSKVEEGTAFRDIVDNA